MMLRTDIRRAAQVMAFGFAMLVANSAFADIAPPPHENAEHDGGPGTQGGHQTGTHGEHEDPSENFNWFNGIPFGYKNYDAKGGPLGDGKLGTGPGAPAVDADHEEKMSAPFILMFVNFGILLFILAKFAGPAARKAAESRSDQIKNALEESAKLRQQAAAKLEEYKTKLSDADAQIAKLVADMKADAAADKQRILAAAEAQATALKRDAEIRIAAEITRARAELRNEVAIAATAAAERVLRERANAADHTKLVDTFISDLMRVPHGATTTSKESR